MAFVKFYRDIEEWGYIKYSTMYEISVFDKKGNHLWAAKINLGKDDVLFKQYLYKYIDECYEGAKQFMAATKLEWKRKF